MRGGDSATGAVVAAWEALAPDGGGGGARRRDGLSTFHIYSFTAHLPGCLYLGMTGRSWPLCSASSPSTPTSGPTSKVSTPSSRRPNLTLASYRKLSPTMLAATFCYTLTASTLRQASSWPLCPAYLPLQKVRPGRVQLVTVGTLPFLP